MISNCPQSIEPFGKCIGNRLFGILIHPCGNPDRNNRNYNACDSYRQIEVNRVRLPIRTDKMSERNESCKAGNNRQKYQRKSHSQRTLMRATRCRFQVSVRCAMIRMGACLGAARPPRRCRSRGGTYRRRSLRRLLSSPNPLQGYIGSRQPKSHLLRRNRRTEEYRQWRDRQSGMSSE